MTTSAILIQKKHFCCGRLLTVLFAVNLILYKLGIILVLFMSVIHLMSFKIMHLVGADSLKMSPTDFLFSKIALTSSSKSRFGAVLVY
jgi:hypothetical protein